MKRSLLFYVFILINCVAFAQPEDVNFYGDRDIRYDNFTYLPTIKSVECYNSKQVGSLPVILLNTSEALFISFDDLSEDVKELNYTIQHFDASWKPSNLNSNEYIKGFPEDRILNFQFSFNTFKNYVHYDFVFPNRNMKPLISGNYILKIYEQNNPELLILTRRFMVLDTKVSVTGYVTQSNAVGDRRNKQKVNFTVDHPNLVIINPFTEVRGYVLQNQRWDNAQLTSQPIFIRNDKLIYEEVNANVFNGGNEFRQFDIRSNRFKTQFVSNITQDSLFNYFLTEDFPKNKNRFITNFDINGTFRIANSEGSNPDIDADYSNVTFSLKYPAPLNNGNFYLFGGLTGWQVREKYKLSYDYKFQRYTSTQQLKQGFYDYSYVFMEDGKKYANETITEGDFFETENDYYILVYDRPQNGLYDQLVGFLELNTLKDFR